jgi:hypothetical protein
MMGIVCRILPSWLAMALLSGPAVSAADRIAPAGEGVICGLAIYHTMAEVGRQCMVGKYPEFQGELLRATAQFDAFVLQNSAISVADLDKFKRDQARVGSPRAAVCQEDLMGIYETMAKRGAEALRVETSTALARPGTPTWGDCL